MWDKKVQIDELRQFSKNTMVEHLGIEFTELDGNHISARMPVDHRTHQPMGLLHGGASVALAETLGSVASSLLVDMQGYSCVGIEINANHIKSVSSGFVHGTATPLHVGRKTHVWDIRITNEEHALVCVSRLTVAIVDKKK
jgi:1,4-dihydroxy-2-naphthoyl-CoA hydrolase